MNRLALCLVFGWSIAAAWISSAMAEPPKEKADAEVVTIPLDKIFALSMPGTRDVRELEPKLLPENLRQFPASERRGLLHGATISQIADSLSTEAPSWPRKGGKAKSGFVVSGTPLDALNAACSILVNGINSITQLHAGEDLNLVFFSHSFESYVHIQGVERNGDSIEIRYNIIPHSERHVTPNFAIIPLGSLSPGRYEVKMVLLPLEQEFLDKGYMAASDDWIERMVCGSFSFDVQHR